MSAASAASATKRLLPIDWAKAHTYAETYCSQGNDCPDGQFSPGFTTTPPFFTKNTDCTHFVAHVLAAGGVRPHSSLVNCKSNLMIRVRELPGWFDAQMEQFSNVRRVASWQETKARDVAILLEDNEPHHAVFLNGPCDANGAVLFGHAWNRCGRDHVPFPVDRALFYRITWFDGVWKEPTGRFSLDIQGTRVKWTETRAGHQLTVTVDMEVGSEAKISRANSDEVLVFLDFPNKALRDAILAAGPKPSFMTLALSSDGAHILATWCGLMVRKKANGSLDSLVQPGSGAGASFQFTSA